MLPTLNTSNPSLRTICLHKSTLKYPTRVCGRLEINDGNTRRVEYGLVLYLQNAGI